jgi:cell division protein FtsL
MIDNLLYCVQEIVLKQFKNYKMENLKNIVMSSEFISLFITNGIIFAVILVIISRYKTRVKFYQADPG